MYEALIGQWAKEQGFQTWANDHAAVLRNMAAWMDKSPASPHPEAREEDIEAILYALYQAGLRQGKWLVQNTGPNSPVPMQPSMEIHIYEAMDALSRLAAPNPEGQKRKPANPNNPCADCKNGIGPRPDAICDECEVDESGLPSMWEPAPAPRAPSRLGGNEMSYNGEEISDQEWDAADRDQFEVEAEEPAPAPSEEDDGGLLRDAIATIEKQRSEIIALRSQLARKDEGMRMALEEAAQSLEALAGLAGKDETMLEYDQVRGYALNRAMAARAALREPDGRKVQL